MTKVSYRRDHHGGTFVGCFRRIVVVLIFFVILTIFTGVVSAENWTVNPGDSIQSAVNNALDNDTIIVNNNNGTNYTYTENIVVDKKLVIQSPNGLVTIKAANSNNPVFSITSTGTGSTIQGFIINGGSYGVKVATSSCTISDNTIYGNKL